MALVLLVGCASGQGDGPTPSSLASSAEASTPVSEESSAASSVDAGVSAASSATGEATALTSANATNNSDAANNTNATNILLITTGSATLEARLEDNVATAELVALLQEGPITLNLHEYGGFEMIGGLPQKLTTADEQISTSTGDIVLYQGNQISFFYASNSWSYTRLGHIDGYDSAALLEALGGPYDSTVELSLQE